MTHVFFFRGNVANGLEIKGHQDGVKGQDIYCAGISAIASTLINGIMAEELMDKPNVRVEDGFVLVTCMRTPRTDAMFDMAEAGLRAMAAKWPDRVTIEVK